MTHDFRDDPTMADAQVEELLDDIEMRSRADLAAAREMSSIHCKAEIVIRPGNAAVSGRAVELRSHGLTSLAETPLNVGDVYHLTFDRTELDIDPLLAVCDRCTMLGDTSFEARFRFFNEVPRPSGS